MKLTVQVSGRTVDLGDVGYGDEIIGVQLNGKDLFGIDLFYLNPDHPDPWDNAPTDVHINLGHWPNGEEWEVLAHLTTAGTDVNSDSDDPGRVYTIAELMASTPEVEVVALEAETDRLLPAGRDDPRWVHELTDLQRRCRAVSAKGLPGPLQLRVRAIALRILDEGFGLSETAVNEIMDAVDPSDEGQPAEPVPVPPRTRRRTTVDKPE